MLKKIHRIYCDFFGTDKTSLGTEEAHESYTEIKHHTESVRKLRSIFAGEKCNLDDDIFAPIAKVFGLISEVSESEAACSDLQKRTIACAAHTARAIGGSIFTGSELPENRHKKDFEWQMAIFLTGLLFPVVTELNVDVDRALTYVLPNGQVLDQRIIAAMRATLLKTGDCIPTGFSDVVKKTYNQFRAAA